MVPELEGECLSEVTQKTPHPGTNLVETASNKAVIFNDEKLPATDRAPRPAGGGNNLRHDKNFAESAPLFGESLQSAGGKYTM